MQSQHTFWISNGYKTRADRIPTPAFPRAAQIPVAEARDSGVRLTCPCGVAGCLVRRRISFPFWCLAFRLCLWPWIPHPAGAENVALGNVQSGIGKFRGRLTPAGHKQVNLTRRCRRMLGRLFGMAAAFSMILMPVSGAVPMPGTPDSPELYDANGDVTYSAAYPGPRDRSFLDINRSWMDVDETAQTFSIHVRVESTDGLEEAVSTSLVGCTMEARLFAEGNETGRIQWDFFDDGTPTHPAPGPIHLVQIQDTQDRNRVLESQFEVQPGTPGHYVWTVRRADVIGVPATNIVDLQGLCNERYGGTATTAFPLVVNLDRAESESDYSLFADQATGGDAKDDLDSLNSGLPPIATSGSETHTKTPALALALVVVALLGAVGARRLRP